MGARLDPSAADFKLRLSVAQGNHLINYSLFTGGINYRLDRETGDGNDRIGFTGERHGTGAPVSPEGKINYTLPRLARSNHALLAVEDKVATMDEQRDFVAFAFIPDYFMTESVYPKSEKMRAIADNLRANRFGGPGQVLARAMQPLTFRFGAVDIQNRPLDPARTPVLALSSARYMDACLQRSLVDYLERGGKIFMHGEVPLYDITGADCRVLLDALGRQPVGERMSSSSRYFLSLVADGWAVPRAELRSGFAQTFTPVTRNGELLFRVYGAVEACAFDMPVGDGRAIVVAADVPCDLSYFETAFDQLGARPGLTHDCAFRGIVMTSTTNDLGERFVHALNLDGFDTTIHIHDNGQALFDGRPVTLRARDGAMLPVNVDLDGVRVRWSTAEIASREANGLTVRLTGESDAVVLQTDREIAPSDAYTVQRDGDVTLVLANQRGTGGDRMTVRW